MIRYVCDICKKEITDEWEVQEMLHINHICGYGSIIGDGTVINIDICEKCFKQFLNDNEYIIKTESREENYDE